MAKKISDLTDVTTSNDIHGADELIINDVSDTTQSNNGSTKRVLVGTLSGAIGGGGSGGGGGSADSLTSSTQNTMVSAYEVSGESEIRFITNDQHVWSIDTAGDLVTPTGKGFGNHESMIGTTLFDTQSIWIGGSLKIVQDATGGLGVMRRSRSGNDKPQAVLDIENGPTVVYNGSTQSAPNVETWYRDQVNPGSNSNIIYEQVPIEYVVGYVRYFNTTSNTLSAATVDDVFPPLGSSDYNADDWDVNTPIVSVTPDRYNELSMHPVNGSGGQNYMKLDVSEIGGNTRNIVDWSVVDTTSHNRLEINEESAAPPVDERYSVLVQNMTGDFTGVRFRTNDSDGNSATIYLTETNSWSAPTSPATNACEFEIRRSPVIGTAYYFHVDVSQLTGSQTDMYSTNGHKMYNDTSLDLYRIRAGSSSASLVSNIYVYFYQDSGVLNRLETIATDGNATYGGLITGSDITVTSTDSGGYATEFYIASTSLDIYVTQTYLNYSSYTNNF